MEDLKKIQEFFSKPLEERMSLDDQAKAYFLAKVKSGEIDTLPEDPKAAFLHQMMKDQMDHDKETLRRERGLEEGAVEIMDSYNRILDLLKKESRALNDDDSYALGLKLRAWFEKNIIKENMSLDDQAKAYYLAKVKSGEIDTLPEDPKAAFLAQMTKDQIAHDKETLRKERGL